MVVVISSDSAQHILLPLLSKYLIPNIVEDTCLAKEEGSWFGTKFASYITV